MLSTAGSIGQSRQLACCSTPEKGLSYKYVGQVESIFKNLLKPLELRSFLNNDLVLLTDIPSKIQKASVKHGLK